MAIDSDLLKKFSEAHGISGHEDEVRSLVAQELEGYGEFSSDGSGSLFCTGGGAGSRVMLAAHMDEIGFLVQNIASNGFLQLVGIGGWWPHTLLSQRVLVKTRSGRGIRGVIGSKPPHFLPEGQRIGKKVSGTRCLVVRNVLTGKNIEIKIYGEDYDTRN